jgi:hypothetical protein
VLTREGCSHSLLINDMKAEELIPDLFAGLKTQYSQIKFFKKKFDFITTVMLPVIQQDFGRHKTSSTQSFQQQNYVCVSSIDELGQLLNIKEICTEEMYNK